MSDSRQHSASVTIGRFQLLPLHMSWNRDHGRYAWHKDADGFLAETPVGPVRLTVTEIEGSRIRRVQVAFQPRLRHRLHQLEIRYATPAVDPDYVWAPYLRPRHDFVIADQVFRSPLLHAEKDGERWGLVPDLATWPGEHRAVLDFLREGASGACEMAHGVGGWKTTGHVFFRRARNGKWCEVGDEFRFGHYLLDGMNIEQSASFIWRTFGDPQRTLPLVLPLEEYEAAALERMFAPDMYHEFDGGGRPVGAMITQTITARRTPKLMGKKGVDSYLRNQGRLVGLMRLIQTTLFTNAAGYRLLKSILHAGFLDVLPMASFQCWFNQVRTALGVALVSRRGHGEVFLERAQRIVELALQAPLEQGLMPSVCLFPEGEIRWMRGTRAFEIVDRFHLPDNAVTAFHLLEWYETVAAEDRILARCREIGDTLLELQHDDGSVPSWVTPQAGGWDVDPTLARSAASAAPAMLWARLARVTGEETYRDAAAKVVDFLDREVMPADQWFDYELRYSCAGRHTDEHGADPFTGTWPMNTLSMYWAARAALDLATDTHESRFLDFGRRVMARLNLFQQVFDHPHLGADTYGGFAVMNADAEYNDARQGLFVPLYLDWYRATGEAEWRERGLAALRACFMTMWIEENRVVAPGNMRWYRPEYRGAILENYAHSGRDEGPAGYLSPDWGGGTALYASGLAAQAEEAEESRK
ncbi:MAG: hypothetical protein P9L99_07405 [Candidatus Lernaella stagnicola]|nr:hypothetical protein [Candidatus Lernaella stagnicola]